MYSPDPSQPISRRRVLGGLLAAPAAIALAGCSDGGSSTTAGVTSSSSTTTAAAGAASTTTSAGATTSTAWAVGGTDLITVPYPSDDIFAGLDACSLDLTEATTLGPCYFASDTGEDISLGLTGLPTQLCAQLVDPDCNPLEGYTIEAWHCDTRGVYSGDTSESSDASSFAGDFCTGGDDAAESSTWYRGQRTTDSAGRVNFKTCFPGWYAGRTIHIHFAVSDPDGTTRVISQWCFPDAFAADICTTHELYADRGVQDTPLEGGTDTVFPSDGFEEFMLNLEQNSDGSLLAYGVIRIDPNAVASEAAAGGGGEPPSGDDRPEPPNNDT